MIKITYYVHGTTIDNEQKIASGHRDISLSEKGTKDAIRLREIAKDREYDFIFCSDLKRAVQTAYIVFENSKDKIIIDKRLRECFYGELDGTKNSVKYSEHIYSPFPSGESLKDVEKRIKDFISFLTENFDGKKIAIISHRVPQLAFEVITKNILWEDAIENDWRKKNLWQPGWEYIIK